VVHTDGTARAQLVEAKNNPGFHRILTEFKRRCGNSVVLNTSFNIHEEPIVRTPEEGVTSFMHAGLDYLSIGGFLARSGG
jgi:carbamoyltransferase